MLTNSIITGIMILDTPNPQRLKGDRTVKSDGVRYTCSVCKDRMAVKVWHWPLWLWSQKCNCIKKRPRPVSRNWAPAPPPVQFRRARSVRRATKYEQVLGKRRNLP